MNKYTFTVSNMNCDGCVANIKQALESDDRISDFQIELSKKMVDVEGSLSSEAAAMVIRDAGYDVVEGQEKKGFLGSLFSR